MKKKNLIVALLAFSLCLLSACQCTHEWQAATCQTPQTCSLCGVTEGEVADHSWVSATCTAPKTCSHCGLTEGKMLQHSWIPTSCAAPQTCSLCGLAEGTALDHDWVPATCEAPETCSQCAAVQGQPLGHSFDSWHAESISADTMTHTCQVCDAAETVPADQTLLLEQALEGSWEPSSLSQSGNTYSMQNRLDLFSVAMVFQEGKRGDLYTGSDVQPFTWELTDADKSENAGESENSDQSENGVYYTLTLTMEDQSQCTCLFSEGDTNSLYFFPNQTDSWVFTQNQSACPLLAGCWAAGTNGIFYSMNLAPDHTFIGNLNGETSGFWYASPRYSPSGREGTYCDILLYYRTETGYKSASATLCLTNEYNPSQFLPRMRLCMDLQINQTDITFHAMDGMAYDELKNEVYRQLCGPWTSCKIESKKSGSRNPWEETETNAFSFNFCEDGTFTAILDMDRTGTWFFDRMYKYYDSCTYYYTIILEGSSVPLTLSIYEEGELSFTSQTNNIVTNITFVLMTEESIAAREAIQAAIAERITGTWTCCLLNTSYRKSRNTYHLQEQRNMLDYVFTFAEDGTFTATLDQEYTGTWTYRDTDVYDNPSNSHTNHYFLLQFDGIPDDITATIMTRDYTANDNWRHYPDKGIERAANGEFFLHYYAPDGNLYQPCFYRLSAEEVEQMRKEQDRLIGTWHANSARQYNFNTQANKDISGEYTLEVFPDGTYTAQVGKTFSGSWCYHPLYEYFSLQHNNSSIICTIQKDGSFYMTLVIDDHTHLSAAWKKD